MSLSVCGRHYVFESLNLNEEIAIYISKSRIKAEMLHLVISCGGLMWSPQNSRLINIIPTLTISERLDPNNAL